MLYILLIIILIVSPFLIVNASDNKTALKALASTIALCFLVLMLLTNYKFNETAYIMEYNEVSSKVDEGVHTFVEAVNLKIAVDRVNERLKQSKEFNKRSELWLGNVKRKLYASYPYIEYTWKYDEERNSEMS